MFKKFRIMVVIAVSTAVYVLARSRGVHCQIVRCLWYANPRRAHFKHLQSGAFMLSGSLCACAFRLSCEVHVRFFPYHAQGSSASVARRLSHLACSQFSFPTPPARVLGGPMPEVRDLLGWRFAGGSRASPLCPTKGLQSACDGWSNL